MGEKDQRITQGLKGGAAQKALRNLRARRIRAHVTKELIETACRKNSGHCMLSDAVEIAAPWGTHIASDLQSIRVTDPKRGLRYTYLTPRTAQLALVAFDNGKNPPPFSFSLTSGHVATSYKRTKLPNGKVRQYPRHKLGRRRIVPGENGNVAGTMGGGEGLQKTGPLAHGPGVRPPSQKGYGGFRREFGMRAFTGSFRLEDLETSAAPVGGPSLSDRA